MRRLILLWFITLVSIPGSSQTGKEVDAFKTVIKTSKQDTAIIQAYLKWGESVWLQFPDSAYNLWKIALQKVEKRLSERSGLQPAVIKQVEQSHGELLYNIAGYHHHKNNISAASEYYFKSLRIFERTNYKIGIGSALNNIGLIYNSYLKDYPRAIKNYSAALELFKQAKDTINQAVALENIGNIYYKNYHDTLKALEYCERSVMLFRAFNNSKALGQGLFNMATIYYGSGNVLKAKENLEECLRIFNEDPPDKRMLCNSLCSLSYIYFKEGKLDKAYMLASKAIKFAQELGFPFSIRKSSNLLQKILRAQHRWKEALEMNDLYTSMNDSLENSEKRSEIIKQQLAFDYEKQTLADSIRFVAAQRVKDLEIAQNQILLSSERVFRNSIIVIALLLLFLAWLFYKRYKLKQDKRQNTLTIQSMETEQKLLRAQMNPHFIFNSLNAIQSLMLDNEVKMSRDYLVKFSLLMRSVLEQTRKSFITLNDELDTLRFYLEMEQLRFNGKFSYFIKCDESIARHKVKLPPLLIQPFVENAIIHGVRHKHGKGTIQVSFHLRGMFIECIVHDDGVGRIKSSVLEEKPGNLKSSVAIELARNRLENMLNSSKEKGCITIIDEEDSEGNSLGTRVELKIPVEFN